MVYDKNTIGRFWGKVKKTSTCWLWQGAKNEKGYGIVSVNGATMRANRVAYEIAKGATGNKHVLHTCNNSTCVNPKHLYLGTNDDNVADRVAANASESENTLDYWANLIEALIGG